MSSKSQKSAALKKSSPSTSVQNTVAVSANGAQASLLQLAVTCFKEARAMRNAGAESIAIRIGHEIDRDAFVAAVHASEVSTSWHPCGDDVMPNTVDIEGRDFAVNAKMLMAALRNNEPTHQNCTLAAETIGALLDRAHVLLGAEEATRANKVSQARLSLADYFSRNGIDLRHQEAVMDLIVQPIFAKI